MNDTPHDPTQVPASAEASTADRAGRLVLWLLILGTVAVIVTIYLRNGAGGHAGPDLVGWAHDFDAATTTAAAEGKPVLLDFTADWCPPCQVMEAEVYSQPRVAEAIRQSFVPVKIDLTNPGAEASAVANRYGVQAIPTLIVVTPERREIARQVGSVDAGQFLAWLDRAARLAE